MHKLINVEQIDRVVQVAIAANDVAIRLSQDLFQNVARLLVLINRKLLGREVDRGDVAEHLRVGLLQLAAFLGNSSRVCQDVLAVLRKYLRAERLVFVDDGLPDQYFGLVCESLAEHRRQLRFQLRHFVGRLLVHLVEARGQHF